ncbi:hypothetical protein JTY60_01655 [symbiont of Argiope bruennichi]|uniref:hypothetical protein n=1 Tax=symbiont of Argiope bruennichi TaxID=2810479 RepID=UPI003DA31E71
MNFKNKKFLPIFLSSLFLVSCSDKIIFHFNKNKIVKTFKDHFGWKKDAAGWGSEDDNKTWNQIVFNINFKKDLESFVSSSSFRNNFRDKDKQSNNILYLPQNFSFNTSVTPVPTTEDELKKF